MDFGCQIDVSKSSILRPKKNEEEGGEYRKKKKKKKRKKRERGGRDFWRDERSKEYNREECFPCYRNFQISLFNIGNLHILSNFIVIVF